MTKLYILAAVFLFWSALAASLMQMQFAASPMHKMRVPTYRSMRAMVITHAHTTGTPTSYN